MFVSAFKTKMPWGVLSRLVLFGGAIAVWIGFQYGFSAYVIALALAFVILVEVGLAASLRFNANPDWLLWVVRVGALVLIATMSVLGVMSLVAIDAAAQDILISSLTAYVLLLLVGPLVF